MNTSTTTTSSNYSLLLLLLLRLLLLLPLLWLLLSGSICLILAGGPNAFGNRSGYYVNGSPHNLVLLRRLIAELFLLNRSFIQAISAFKSKRKKAQVCVKLDDQDCLNPKPESWLSADP